MNTEERFKNIKLSQKEQLIEFLAIGLAALLLIASVLKVLFF